MSYTKKQAALDAKKLWEKIATEPVPSTREDRIILKHRIADELGVNHRFACPYCKYRDTKRGRCISCPAYGLWINAHCENTGSQYMEYITHGNVKPMLDLVKVVCELNDYEFND